MKRNIGRLAICLAFVLIAFVTVNSIKWYNTDDNNPVSYVDVTKVTLRETEAVAVLGNQYDRSKTPKAVYDIRTKWKRGTFPFLKKETDTVRVAHIQVK